MIYIYILDPGHRKDTPGKTDNGLYEYEFNEDVARKLEKKLIPHGEVYFTIEAKTHTYSEMTATGRSQNLNARTSKANQIYYDAVKKHGEDNFKIIFISIHANAYSDSKVSGYEIFVWRHSSKAHELAKRVHKQAQLELGVGTTITDRKIKEGNLAVLRNTKMPAILVEHEFYTNPVAAQKLKDTQFRDKCAEHLYKGVLNYMGIVPEEDKIMKKEIDVIKERLNIIEEHLKFPKEEEEVKQEPSKDTMLDYNRALKFGMTGADVSQLQIRLKELGFYIGEIDGSFGPATDRAVRAYQGANSLVVDGSVGPATIKHLNSKKKLK